MPEPRRPRPSAEPEPEPEEEPEPVAETDGESSEEWGYVPMSEWRDHERDD